MDVHYIIVPVKLVGGLSISVLRNKQLFTKKKGGQKFTISKKGPNFANISNPAI
jgi:hypothetical protein